MKEITADEKGGVSPAGNPAEAEIKSDSPSTNDLVNNLPQDLSKSGSNSDKEKNKTKNELVKKKPAEKMSLLSRMLRPKVLKIKSSVTDNGFLFILSWGSHERKFNVLFPEETWKNLPSETKSLITDNLAHLSSLEIAIMLKAKKISYDTPLPVFKSFFMEVLLKCLLYSGDCDSGKAIDYITRLCNLEFSFKGSHPVLKFSGLETKEASINTMTFGKESLLGFGLCQELGLNPIPVTVLEPDSDVIYRNQHIKTFQNKHKHKLIKQFEQEFNIKVYSIDSELNDIMDYTLWNLDPTDLGWSTQLTQYLFLLMPFNYFFRHKYTIYGNEYSCDSFYYSNEGFKCHPVYDQSAEWMNHINTILQTATLGSVKATSLVQPIHEIAVAKVLYQRYPQLAKYQTSCHANNEGAKKNRWCSTCCKCATCFLFMKALGFDPNIVGLKDMFTLQHKDFYSLFAQSKDAISGYYSLQLCRDEQLFAFQLAVKRGATGELIDLFKKEFWEEGIAREEELKNEFFKVHRQENIPAPLWRKIKPIFEEELKKNGVGIPEEKREEVKEAKKECVKSELETENKETKKEIKKEESKLEESKVQEIKKRETKEAEKEEKAEETKKETKEEVKRDFSEKKKEEPKKVMDEPKKEETKEFLSEKKDTAQKKDFPEKTKEKEEKAPKLVRKERG